MKKHLLAASLLLCSAISYGGGYQLNLQGLRELAMGGTGTASTADASTIFYNPAGISRLKGIEASASILFIMPTTGYSNAQGYSATTKSQTFTPFNIYVGGPLREGSKVGVGIGIYTPFGSGTTWDDNWSGKFLVQSIYLQSVFIQPTISYRVSDFLSVGGGFIYAFGKIDYKEALPVQFDNGQDGQAHLHGNANGVGFNLGVHLKVASTLQIGFTYRSQVNMNVGAGHADFNVPASLQSSFPNTTFDSQLPLPQIASLGISYRPIDALTLQFDLNYTGWNSYDSLRFNFATNTSTLQNEHAPRHYHNTLTPRLGACVKVSKMLSLMVGGAYDPTPTTQGYISPELPDADRLVLTGGIAFKPIPRLTILAAFEGVISSKRFASYDYGNYSGTYQTKAATPGIGINYNF